VLPVFVAVVLFVALLVSYPWYVLSIGSIFYIAALPLGWLSYRGYVQKDAAAMQAATAPAAERGSGVTPGGTAMSHSAAEERPERLN
jgi:CDP-diacylglycerol--serine O-phosphatidyltransferase